MSTRKEKTQRRKVINKFRLYVETVIDGPEFKHFCCRKLSRAEAVKQFRKELRFQGELIKHWKNRPSQEERPVIVGVDLSRTPDMTVFRIKQV